MRHIRRVVTLVLVTLLVSSGSALAQGGEASAEGLSTQLATAIQHSGFAASAEEHGMAVRHLGHVLNCLQGEGGDDFDASWGHPCADQGIGIVNDAAAHALADEIALLVEAANGLAQQGVMQASLGAVQRAAAGVAALLELVAAANGG